MITNGVATNISSVVSRKVYVRATACVRERRGGNVTLDTTISFRLTMFSCLRDLRILISRMAVMGKPSFSVSFCSFTFFSAT